jgi:pimeloyl-ACP methyl ester carboxylesterase
MTKLMAKTGRWLALGLGGLVALLAGLVALGRVPDMPAEALKARYASPASRFLEVLPGTLVHVRDEGPRDGRPVLLLHGSNASLHTWEPWVARLTAAGYRVITLDLPAHGLSGATRERDYSYAAYVRVVDALVTRLNLDKVAIGGNSMGGGVAWWWAVQNKARVAALLLVDSTGQPAPEGSSSPLGAHLAKLPVAREIMASVTPRWIIKRSLVQSVSVKDIVTPAMVDRYWELLLYPGTREATLDRFSQYAPLPDGEALRDLSAPALILWGAEDRLIPVGSAQWFAERLPNARLCILDGVGHIPMEEAPDRSVRPVLELLSHARWQN